MNSLYEEKLKKIGATLLKSGKGGSHLMIVSKTRSPQEIQAYYDLGHRDFGENRIQELAEKSNTLKLSCPGIRWHMIGHIQTNKVNQLMGIPQLWAIHSVDSVALLQKILKAQDKLSSEVKIFLQYKVSGEAEKFGLEDYGALLEAARLLNQHSTLDGSLLQFHGLMAMGTYRTEHFTQEARRCFRELNAVKLKLEKELHCELKTSMGMSQDYPIALEEGSNWIRLGSVMFE